MHRCDNSNPSSYGSNVNHLNIKKETKKNPHIKKEKKVDSRNLKKNAKNIQTKKRGKRKHVMTSEEMRERATDATCKYTYSNKFKSKKRQNISKESKNFYSLIHNPPKLKSILINNLKSQNGNEKKCLVKSNRKVSFCSSIFIRNFQVDSESDDDY